ncbi:MAG: hypothetical protein IJ679_08600, partial [Lachnospiraceae bacterium]|nr:hypothetical protein [Lachnospiraceae bacterium]
SGTSGAGENSTQSEEAPTATSSKTEHTITEKTVPIYYTKAKNKDEITLAFLDGCEDVPYVSLETWKEQLIRIYTEGYRDDNRKDPGYRLDLSVEGDQAVYTRDNQYTLTFDFANDTMEFMDFDAFLKDSGQEQLIDIATLDGRSDDDFNKYVKTKGGYDRYGRELVLNLADYHIDLVKSGDGCYVPLQTMADFLLSTQYVNVFFNGEAVVISINGGMKKEDREKLSGLGKIYYSAEKGQRSEALAEFSYNELCLVLDSMYGLKEVHGIENFDELFDETGLKYRLLDPDPNTADAALYELIDKHLDDLHSSFDTTSYLAGSEPSWDMENTGTTYTSFVDSFLKYHYARADYYPDGCPGYEEVGNTAYITFDSFLFPEDDKVDYYKDDKPDPDAKDTVGLLLYSFDQIMREGSPIENVVMDLSNNTGGQATAAVYAIGMFLRDASVSYEDTLSGARVVNSYVVDTNLDGKYNKKDSLFGKGLKLYCLTSPVSFSCGNLVPSVFKHSDEVTMIGKTSGGGACTVLPLTTAYGTAFKISGSYRLSFVKNGAFYNIDQGAEPDYTIGHPEDFYNRQSLTEFINSIY